MVKPSLVNKIKKLEEINSILIDKIAEKGSYIEDLEDENYEMKVKLNILK